VNVHAGLSAYMALATQTLDEIGSAERLFLVPLLLSLFSEKNGTGEAQHACAHIDWAVCAQTEVFL